MGARRNSVAAFDGHRKYFNDEEWAHGTYLQRIDVLGAPIAVLFYLVLAATTEQPAGNIISVPLPILLLQFVPNDVG